MNSITAIKMDMLDHNQYLISLMNAGVQKGLLDLEFLKSTSLELTEILKDVISMYTKGESTTLKTETVEGLMKSMLYSLDLLLLSYATPEDAINHLKSCSIKALYHEAIEYSKSVLEDTKRLHKSIEMKRIPIPNTIYNESFSDAIPSFLSSYDVIFSAQDTSCDLDYPLTIDHSTTIGIAFIKKYLETFELENEFCLCFTPQSIHTLLKLYGTTHRINYKESPINFFELVFCNAIFSTLLNKSYDNLVFSTIEFALLEKRLSGLDKAQIKNQISHSLEILQYNLNIENTDLKDLLQRNMNSMLLRLNHALEHDNLANMLIKEASTDNEDETILELGTKMKNRDFRLVYNRIMNCTSTQDKIVLIQKYIHSMEDFVDLLKADVFFDTEYGFVFDSFGNIEICALISRELKEYLLNCGNKLSMLFSRDISYKYDWEKAFVSWLSNLDTNRIQAIELQLANNLRNEII